MTKKNISDKSEQGKRLKELRDYLHLTQGEFGEKIGLKWSQVKDRESGIVKISPSEAKIISHEYDISYEWLLTGQGVMRTGAGSGEQQSNNTKGGSETELDDWQMRQLLEQITKRLDDMSLRLNDQTCHIQDATMVITRYRNELELLQKNQADLKVAETNINQALDDINTTLLSIKGRMLDAAQSGSVEALGGDIVNG